jgi:hypothetical protein
MCVSLNECFCYCDVVRVGVFLVLERSEPEHQAIATLFVTLNKRGLLTATHFYNG